MMNLVLLLLASLVALCWGQDEVTQTEEVTQTDKAIQPDEGTQTDGVIQSDEVTQIGEAIHTDEEKKTNEVKQPDEVKETDEVKQPDEVKETDEVKQPDEVKKTDEVKQPDEGIQTGEDAHQGQTDGGAEQNNFDVHAEDFFGIALTALMEYMNTPKTEKCYLPEVDHVKNIRVDEGIKYIYNLNFYATTCTENCDKMSLEDFYECPKDESEGVIKCHASLIDAPEEEPTIFNRRCEDSKGRIINR